MSQGQELIWIVMRFRFVPLSSQEMLSWWLEFRGSLVEGSSSCFAWLGHTTALLTLLDGSVQSSGVLSAFSSCAFLDSLLQWRDYIPSPETWVVGLRCPWQKHGRELRSLKIFLMPEQAAYKTWKLTINNKEVLPKTCLSVSPSIPCIQWNQVPQGKKHPAITYLRTVTIQAQKWAEQSIHSTLLGFPTSFSAWFSYLFLYSASAYSVA